MTFGGWEVTSKRRCGTEVGTLLSWDSVSLVRVMSMIVLSWYQRNKKETVVADEVRPVYTLSITDKLTCTLAVRLGHSSRRIIHCSTYRATHREGADLV